MFIIKKLFLFLILMLGLLTLVGCGLFGNGKIDDKYFENFEEINSEKEKVYDNFNSKITDDAQKTAFSVDYMVIGSADFLAAMYISIVNLYNLTPALVSQNIEKSKDTYTITGDEDNSKVIVRYDNDTKSTQLEFYENNVLEYLVETTELSDGGYAYQLYSASGDEKLIYEFYFKDGNGRLAVKENVQSKPSTIYKKNSVPSSFATTGDRVYKLDNGNYTFTGELEFQKTVTDFVMYSGLKNEYLLNETFDVTKLVIKVTYSDTTTANVNVTGSMLNSIPNMSTTGTKSFKLTYGGIEKTFTFNVVNQLKTITNFSIKSGLNPSYIVDSQFNVNNILLEVTYDDNSKEDIYVTNEMIVGEVPTTTTAGEKQLVLKVGSIQKTFTFTVTEKSKSIEEKLGESYSKFFKTLYMDSDAFVTTYMQNFMGKGNNARDKFMLNFTEDLISQWGSTILAFEAVTIIQTSLLGDFNTLYPTPSNDWGKNNYLNYEDGIFHLGMWIKKGSFNQYWFEFDIEFDEEKDAFKMHVTSGIGDQLVERAILEYVGYEEGKYAANVYFYDENTHGASHSVYQFLITKNTGSVIKNYMVDSVPQTIINQTNFVDYAKTGDKVFEMSSSSSSIYTKNVNSQAYLFYASLAYTLDDDEYVYDGSVQDSILKKVIELDEEYEFDSNRFSLNNYYLEYAIEVIRAYEEKEFRNFYNGMVATVSKTGNTTTIKLEDDYDLIEIKVRYVENKLKIEYLDDSNIYNAEIIKSGNEYFVQIAEESKHSNFSVITKARYIDSNNAVFVYLEGEGHNFVSIYDMVPSDFLTKGKVKFELKNFSLDIIHAYIICVLVDDDSDPYYLYTDFSGNLVLPEISNPKFQGWYIDDEEFIGKGNATYKFTFDADIFARFDE